MEIDERLQRAFDALAERLQQEINTQLGAVRADLVGSAQADRNTALAEAVREARAIAERDASERHQQAVTRAGQDARSEAAAAETAASERLLAAVRGIDGAPSLSDILDVLINAAVREVNRAGIFLPQGSMLKAWRLAGFETTDAGGSGVELPFGEAGMIAEAAETARVIRLDAGSPRATLLPSFVELPEHARAVAIPLVMTGQVFAVLYADEGNDESGRRESWRASLEVMARHGARALEAITAVRMAQVGEAVVSR